LPLLAGGDHYSEVEWVPALGAPDVPRMFFLPMRSQSFLIAVNVW